MINFIKEIFRNKSSKESNLHDKVTSQVWGALDSKFARDIFTRKRRTIHEEMELCKEAYRENSLVHTSVETMTDLIKGDGFFIDTKNELLKRQLENKGFLQSGYSEAADVAVREAVITGNGYIEAIRDEKGNIRKFLPFVNSEDIFIDYNYESGKITRYVQRTYLQPTQAKKKPVSIRTPYGIETVIGNIISPENIIHIKLGNAAWGVYGRSDIVSILDDLRILETIERSIAVIAKYKAIPKKALMIEKREGETPLNEKELIMLAEFLRNQSDYENPILNRKLEALDLSSGGSEIRMEGYIDYLKRKITISMAPEFLIHGQEVNRATSREQKQTYFLRIASKRAMIEPTLTKALISYVMGLNNKLLIGEFKFKFGEFDVILPEEKEQRVQERWQKGLITLKEARQLLGLEELEGTDYFITELNQGNMLGNEPEN